MRMHVSHRSDYNHDMQKSLAEGFLWWSLSKAHAAHLCLGAGFMEAALELLVITAAYVRPAARKVLFSKPETLHPQIP